MKGKSMVQEYMEIANALEAKSGYELRQERYRESNENKKSRDLDRRQKRKNKRSQAY